MSGVGKGVSYKEGAPSSISDMAGCSSVREAGVPYGTTAETDRDTVSKAEIEQLRLIDEGTTLFPTPDTRHLTPSSNEEYAYGN